MLPLNFLKENGASLSYVPLLILRENTSTYPDTFCKILNKKFQVSCLE